MAESQLTPVAGQRRVVIVTAFLASAISLVAEATSEYMLVPIQSEFHLSVDDTNSLALLPFTGGLLVIFAVGALAVRYGRRAVIVASAASMCLGSALVSFAPNAQFLIPGRLLCGLGGVGLTVIGLSLINVSFPEPAHRARAFGALGGLTPAVFIVAPTLSAVVCATFGWRFVPILWFTGSLAVLALALSCLPARARRPTSGELVTPLAAGVALTALCAAVTSLVNGGATVVTVIALVIAVASSVLVAVLVQRMRSPSLDLRVLRRPGAILAAGAVLMALVVNIAFYVNLFIQYEFDLPLPTTAMLLALPEIGGVAGSLALGALAARIGPGRAATIALATAAVLPITMFAISPSSPVWALIILTVLVYIPCAGTLGPLADYFLGFAPDDGSDAASSVHNAVTQVGFVLGGLAVGFFAFTGFQRTLTNELTDRGFSTERSYEIAARVRSGVVAGELVDRSRRDEPDLNPILVQNGSALSQARVDALHSAAASLMLSSALGAGMLVLSARRRFPRREGVN
ncbi:MAG: MFS transporter [Actinomycetes bacterium]